MDIHKIFGKLKAEDVPIFTVPEHDVICNYLHTLDNDVSIIDISKATGITKERLLEINQEISLHFKDNLAPKVFYKAMMNAGDNDSEEFKQFFIRADVDISCLFMSRVSDIKKNMRNLNTPGYIFLLDNWKKHGG